MTTKTQTIAENAPAWAMPGMQVARLSGYGGRDHYSVATVARHTRTTIVLEAGKAFKLRNNTWTEVGASKYYEDTIHELGGKTTEDIDRAQKLQTARNEVQNAAQTFAKLNRRWTTTKDAEELQEALGRFITTMTALGEIGE